MRSVVLASAVIFLTGCAPVSIYYKPGVAVAKSQSDQLDCEVSAQRDAPVNTQVRQEPDYFVPARRVCSSQGVCSVRGGYWRPGRVYSYDANAGLRDDLLNQCMARKGYQPASIPLCSSSVANATPAGRTTTLPTLTANSCAIRNDDGSFQIVNRG